MKWVCDTVYRCDMLITRLFVGITLLLLLGLSGTCAGTPYPANLVLGQSAYTTKDTGIMVASFTAHNPYAVTVGDDKIFVVDSENNRVLWWNSANAYYTGRGADGVVGQPDFTTISSGTTAGTLNFPTGAAVDSSNNLWVTDGSNNRILKYNASAIAAWTPGVPVSAELVLGHTDFITGAAGTTAGTLNWPVTLTFDSSGNIWVADSNNDRIVRYSSASITGWTLGVATNADLVLGQPNFLTGTAGTAAGMLYYPTDVAVDSSGNVWVADRQNNRVLRYNSATVAAWTLGTASNADLVLGQTDFNTATPGTTAGTLSWPVAVTLDPSGNVWVADRSNNRILEYKASAIAGYTYGALLPADLVLGQPDFNTGTTGTTARTLNTPFELAIDSSGNVWATDLLNNRVLRYNAAAIAAWTSGTAVDAAVALGQPRMTTGQTYWTTAQTLYYPYGMAQGGGRIFAADGNNNRVLWWNSSAAYTDGRAADGVIGQADFHTFSSGTTASTFYNPYGLAVDLSGNLWVTDRSNSRVLRYSAAAIAAWTSGTALSADLVLGQPDFTTDTAGTTADTLNFPHGVAVDSAGNLWVADRNNNRILEYKASTIAAWTAGTASNADLVIGQPDFNTGINDTSASTLRRPFDVDVDFVGNVWVTDRSNHRVLRYSAATIAAWTLGTAPDADLVLGQADFTTAAAGTSATTLSWPSGVTVDPSGNVWVADRNNNRILEYKVSTIVGYTYGTMLPADLVLGQPDFNTGTAGTTDSTLSVPMEPLIDSAGNVWAADSSNNRILRFDGLGGTGFTADGNITLGGVAMTGVTVTVSGSSTTAKLVDAYGGYSFLFSGGGPYMLTPSKPGYTFTPVSFSTAALVDNWTGNNFTAVRDNYTVSGTVSLNGSPLPGVTITVSGSSVTYATTDSAGNYSFAFDSLNAYTLTPSKTGYGFTPPVLSTASLSGNWTGNDFAASSNTCTISGNVTLNGSPMSGVTVNVSGSSNTATITNASGNYYFSVSALGGYTVAPSKTGYTFSPVNLSTVSLLGNWTGNDFTAAFNMRTIQGTLLYAGAPLPGVTITVTGSSTASAITDNTGTYSLTLVDGGSYTLIPSKTGYVFAPPSVTTTTLSGNWTVTSFSTALTTYTVSGVITANAVPLSGVTVTLSGDAAATASTDASGQYTFSLPKGAYVLTPARGAYYFDPPQASAIVGAAGATNDFTAGYAGSNPAIVEGGDNGYVEPKKGPAKIRLMPTRSGHVTVKIYTVRKARLIRTLEADVAGRTMATLLWDCRDTDGEAVSSGVYMAVVNGAGFDGVKIKMGVLR